MNEKRLKISPTHRGGTALTAKQKYSEKQTIKESKKTVTELHAMGCFTCWLSLLKESALSQPRFALVGFFIYLFLTLFWVLQFLFCRLYQKAYLW